jgi:hypothetical protein
MFGISPSLPVENIKMIANMNINEAALLNFGDYEFVTAYKQQND